VSEWLPWLDQGLALLGGGNITAAVAEKVDGRPGSGYALQLDADRLIAEGEASLKGGDDTSFAVGALRILRGDVGRTNVYTGLRNYTWEQAWDETDSTFGGWLPGGEEPKIPNPFDLLPPWALPVALGVGAVVLLKGD
jgi:hypothetical protein